MSLLGLNWNNLHHSNVKIVHKFFFFWLAFLKKKIAGLEIPTSPLANAMRNGQAAGYHFSATFVQFLSKGLQDIGKGYHIENMYSGDPL